MKSIVTSLLLTCTALLAACDLGNSRPERWYSQEQVVKGEVVYSTHCAVCHGDRAQGLVADWQRRLPDGFYPPPPLNGTAHAWHHSLPLLIEIVQKGGVLYDGKMPGFERQLSEEEQIASIVWFQSLWSDETYRLWKEGNTSPKISGSHAPKQAKTGG
jgi:mono/diheme cytochrome c family protein